MRDLTFDLSIIFSRDRAVAVISTHQSFSSSSFSSFMPAMTSASLSSMLDISSSIFSRNWCGSWPSESKSMFCICGSLSLNLW